MKVILGGGLVALLARDILGSDWTIVPIGRSRFYSFDPPIVDNYIIKNDVIDEYMKQYTIIPLLYRTGYSYCGQILFNARVPISPFLLKVYGSNIPSHAEAYWLSRMDHFGYGNCCDIYKSLQDKYKSEVLANNAKFGIPISIKDHEITTTTGAHTQYESIISTVPLSALLKWVGIDYDLKAKDVHCFHMRTDALDFEGATKLFVVDQEIDFYEVVMLDRLNYVFHAHKPIDMPGKYFMKFIKRFDLVAETKIEGAIQCGPIPEIPELDDVNIIRVGSSVWDDCLDVGSSIKRLIKAGHAG